MDLEVLTCGNCEELKVVLRSVAHHVAEMRRPRGTSSEPATDGTSAAEAGASALVA